MNKNMGKLREMPRTNHFLLRRMALIVMNCEEYTPISRIARNCDITYVHVIRVIKMLEKEDILTLAPHGRSVFLTLTEKGKELRKHLIGVYDNVFEGSDNDEGRVLDSERDEEMFSLQ